MKRMACCCLALALALFAVPAAAREDSLEPPERSESASAIPPDAIATPPLPPAPRLAGPVCRMDCMLKRAMCGTACAETTDAGACVSARCEPVLHQCSALCMTQALAFPDICASHDRAVVALIEEHGARLDGSADSLADAYAAVLQARGECLEGKVNRAVARYRAIPPLLRSTVGE